MTAGSKVKEIGPLIKNLKEVISWIKDTKSKSNAEVDFVKTNFCDIGSFGKGKKMFKERAAQTTQKEKEKSIGKENILLVKKNKEKGQ